ncbi:stage III sporulation protein AG [Paenibacillus sp. FSL H8-0548]|uniref:stage III sporulation protein AG n=1 Tax=Paenibacillus sp. FSL H8-0548 TaxID=1920422 RepID=UPI0009700C6C|nr:stage III sporulation protein AG [Paenibacillus sp. FSL H8-0548]OMF34250.1 stage III sporulation protein AG [Paenibacillus sp. FSL H8-0548]
MAKWLEGIESAVSGGPGGPKRIRTLRILLIVGGIGAALMIMNSFLTYKEVEPSVQDPNPPPQTEAAWNNSAASSGSMFAAIEHPLEARLKEILEKIVGVGSVDVLVTVESTEEIIIAQNEQESQQTTDENDPNGGKRHITSITKDGQVVLYEISGDQKPIITKTINPRIRGILIVARGAENMTVRRLIINAVEKGINVPVNRISVVPSKQ